MNRGRCVSYGGTEQRDWPFRTGSSSTVGPHSRRQRRTCREGRKGPRGMTACHIEGSLSLVGEQKLMEDSLNRSDPSGTVLQKTPSVWKSGGKVRTEMEAGRWKRTVVTDQVREYELWVMTLEEEIPAI